MHYDDNKSKEASLLGECLHEIGKLKVKIKKLEACRDVLEHAVALGYLGEGSTAGWARTALSESEEQKP